MGNFSKRTLAMFLLGWMVIATAAFSTAMIFAN